MTKYKYYLRKPKSEIVKDLLCGLATAGAICIAASSPYFGINLLRGIKGWGKYKKRNVTNNLSRLRKLGCIEVKMASGQIYINLTERGKKLANWMQIDALKITKPKKWDKKWRLVIFDISQLKKFYREIFRGKLKELGFCQLQKSVWVHPFNCEDEIQLLRDFCNLTEKEIRIIVSENIGSDKELRNHFEV
jgi:DNA-binding transcriptional regulator PaaX